MFALDETMLSWFYCHSVGRIFHEIFVIKSEITKNNANSLTKHFPVLR